MFATNLILILALIAMIAGFVWLFRDGEGPARGPGLKTDAKAGEDDDAPAAPRVQRDEPPEA